MAIIIGTVYMSIAGRAALMTFRNNIFGNPLSYPLIKNKIFADKFTWQSFRFYLPDIIYYAAVQLIYICKTMVF